MDYIKCISLTHCGYHPHLTPTFSLRKKNLQTSTALATFLPAMIHISSIKFNRYLYKPILDKTPQENCKKPFWNQGDQQNFPVSTNFWLVTSAIGFSYLLAPSNGIIEKWEEKIRTISLKKQANCLPTC